MYKKTFSIFVFFVLITLFFLHSGANAEEGAIRGIITDESTGKSLPGITVTIDDTEYITFTDEKGNYSFSLPPGTYNLRAEMLGFIPAEAHRVVVVEGGSNKVNFAMEETTAIEGEETVVTGERLTVPLSKTTATVAVVGTKDIEKITAATGASDLIVNTPGVQVEGGGSEFTKTIKIRGRTVAPPSAVSSGILLLIDGVPANDPGRGYADMYKIAPENVERIEVLKGASSAQYGGSASAGVINIITKKGNKKPFTKVSVNFGTYQGRKHAESELYENYSFFHSWGGKRFDYAINAGYSHSSGMTTAETKNIGNVFKLYVEKNPGKGRDSKGSKVFPDRKEIPYRLGDELNELMDDGDKDKAERYSVGLNLGINIFKGNTIRIMPSYSTISFYMPFTPGDTPLQTRTDSFAQHFINVFNRTDRVQVSDKWEITPDITYNVRLGLEKSTSGADFFFINDLIDYNTESEALGKKDRYVGFDPTSPFYPLTLFSVDRSFTLANDLAIKFNILDGYSLSFGHEYQWVKSDSAFHNYNTRFVKHNSQSFFLQNMLSIKKLTLTAGARWEQVTTYIEDFDDEVSPRFGINYEIKPGTTLRFSVGRARRFIEFARQFGLGQSGGRLYGNPEIGPEINWTYELGFRFATKYISGDIAYFYDDYSDYEIPVPVSAVGYSSGGEYSEKVLGVSRETLEEYQINPDNIRAGLFINGPDAVFQGFDTSFEIKPMKNWDINVSYLFQRAVVGSNNPFDFGQGQPQTSWIKKRKGLGPKFEGEMRIEYIPTHIFKVSSGYTLPFGLRTDINGRYKSTTQYFNGTFVGGLFEQPEHWVWDLKLTQPFMNGKMKFTVAIENVFSKLYYENGGIPSNVARYVFGIEAQF